MIRLPPHDTLMNLSIIENGKTRDIMWDAIGSHSTTCEVFLSKSIEHDAVQVSRTNDQLQEVKGTEVIWG